MNLKRKRTLRSVAATIAATAALTVAMPSGNAFAINHIQCGDHKDFLKIWSHLYGMHSVDCYANAGRAYFYSWWVDRISTGNNDIIFYDVNGDKVRINRWHDITFPNHPPHVKAIKIL